MPFLGHDLQRLSHLARLERELVRNGEQVTWDLRQIKLVIQTPSRRAQIQARMHQGHWVYAWAYWPWCRAEALEEDAAAHVLRGVWL